FDGNCQDGQCSIWSATVYDDGGNAHPLSCQQRTPTTYKIVLDKKEHKGNIAYTTTLAVREFSTANGFMDLVYPVIDTTTFTKWLMKIIDPVWKVQEDLLKNQSTHFAEDRLAFRTSAWIEIVEENEQWLSGLLTIQLPDSTFREAFLWLKREQEIVSQEDWLMGPIQQHTISSIAVEEGASAGDEYGDWLRQA